MPVSTATEWPQSAFRPLKVLRVVGPLVETLAGPEVVDEVDLLLPGLGVGERRVPDVELPVHDAGDDGVESRVDQSYFDSHHLPQSHAEVGVEAHYFAVLDELVRWVGGVHCHSQA